jgi:ATP-binding cassette subfamily B protein
VSPIYASLRIILAIVQALASTVFPALATARFVNTALPIFAGTLPLEDIGLPLVLLIVVLGVFTTSGSIVQLVDARIRLDVQCKTKPTMIRMQSKLDYKHIENAACWELISRVFRDPTASLADGFGAYALIVQIVISIGSVLGLIVAQIWWAAVMIVAFATPMFWLSQRAGKKNYQAGRDAERFNRRTEYLDEVLTGRDNVEERTLFGYGKEIGARWRAQYEAGRILQLKVSFRVFLATKGSGLILSLISLLITLTLIGPVASGILSPGLFMGIVNAVFGMINLLAWQMSSAMERISRISEYMKDLNAFLNLSQTPNALTEPDTEPLDFDHLQFQRVRFHYPSGDRLVLDGLNFTLTKGRHYAFVGKNGAGKSTIIKLLTGLYTDYEGKIFINGRELRTYPSGALKALFSIVYQDFVKYPIPLRDNIALGDIARIAATNVEPIVELAGLNDIVAQLKEGLDTPLGKVKANGQELSDGQWQRVAIARSLISRAPVQILDEPTATLDPINESHLYQEFDKLMRNKTTIFVSHRLGSTKLADEILVVDGGAIVERGTHDELMAAGGQYAEMYASQSSWYQ